MKLPRMTQMKYFAIYQPRYHDKRVLLAAHKVGEHNKIVFLQAPDMGTEPYYVSGKTVKKYPKQSNGAIKCYAVPLSELETLELTRDIKELI